jgi:hypothetical protein
MPTKSKNTKLKESGGDYFISFVDVTDGHPLPHRPLPATPCLQTFSKTCWLPPVLLRLQYESLILDIVSVTHLGRQFWSCCITYPCKNGARSQ